MSIAPEEEQSIRFALRDARWQALSDFMNDFIHLLIDEGFSFEDLLHALAHFSDSQLQYKKATIHLEEAAKKIPTHNPLTQEEKDFDEIV